jgi:hypothetical protein
MISSEQSVSVEVVDSIEPSPKAGKEDLDKKESRKSVDVIEASSTLSSPIAAREDTNKKESTQCIPPHLRKPANLPKDNINIRKLAVPKDNTENSVEKVQSIFGNGVSDTRAPEESATNPAKSREEIPAAHEKSNLQKSKANQTRKAEQNATEYNKTKPETPDAKIWHKISMMASRFTIDQRHRFQTARHLANDVNSPLLALPFEILQHVLALLRGRSQELQKFASLCQSAMKAVSNRFWFYNFSRSNYAGDAIPPQMTVKSDGFASRAFVEVFYEANFHANNRRIQEKLSLITLIKSAFNYGNQVQYLELTRVPLVTVSVVRKLLRNMPNLKFLRKSSEKVKSRF